MDLRLLEGVHLKLIFSILFRTNQPKNNEDENE